MRINCSFQFIYVCLFISGLAASPANALEFDVVGNGGNCTGCEWISASGLVELDDAEKFEKFLKSADWEIKPFRQHNLITFDSIGGSLSGGIKLGKKIRELGFGVAIGKSVPVPDSVLHELQDGVCISACAYAFLGGKYRYTGDNNTCLGFHQFYDKAALSRENSSSSLSTQQSTQIISGIVVQYLFEIGVPLEIYTFASKFTGQEYGCLNKDAVLNPMVDNSSYEFSKARLLPFGKGLVAEVEAINDGRSMRFYCMDNGKMLAAFFLAGDVVDDYKAVLGEVGDNSYGLVFSAKDIKTSPRLELIQTISGGAKTAIVFKIDNSFIDGAFKFGQLDTSKSNTGRAQQSWLNYFNFTIVGSQKIPALLKQNCIS